ncbi:Aldose 1-epimerase [Caballeronia sordidicola]|uniref:Aldose 1-epimerase n=2 Tax=Caballeronia sordidicola TaxID=196367 RepID=A0A242MU08_CABSO|nr:Aldose 1-epimerase [Caballeronia sordidicola]
MNLAAMPTIARTGSVRVSAERWGALPGGDVARLFTLRNAHGMRVAISDLGATLVSWNAPDRAGRVADVLLGHDTPAAYFAGHAYLGGVIGRWANRIENARFALGGVAYSLDRNEGGNLLHGGAAGFHRALWDAQEVDGGIELTHESPEGEAGFPGAVSTKLRYTLDDDGTLTLAYEAVSDAPTPVNLTNHACFNLSGDDTADIRGHVISIDADTFFEVDAALIPEGRAEVAGHAFDFRASAPLGARLDWPHDQLSRAGGFDHCYVVGERGDSHRPVVRLYDPGSGRELTMGTNAPGVQFYTGNHLDGIVGRHGRRYGKHAGLCLQAGAFPNQVNMPDAGSVIVSPGETYRQVTWYRVGVRHGA